MAVHPDRSMIKYLENFAEPETDFLLKQPDGGFSTHCWQNVIAIPCFDESFGRVSRLCRQIQRISSSVLIILVINSPESASEEARKRTQTLLNEVLSDEKNTFQLASNVYFSPCRGKESALIVVDRCSEGRMIPAKQGVGLARKIAGDLACKLWLEGKLKQPVLFNTDADVALPDDYFSSIRPGEKSERSAWIYPFIHVAEPGIALATQFYQAQLNYYVAGLRYADSPYAFATIGSTIAVHLASYAKVRGFPKRAGGEDFYLLNKLAKVGEVCSLSQPQIKIAGRMSARVPFGTGPALKKLMDNSFSQRSPFWYHPRSFELLKYWQNVLQSGERFRTVNDIQQAINHVSQQRVEIKEWQAFCEYFEQNKVIDTFTKAQQQFKSPVAYQKFLSDWFDGFRTLKLMHHLRANVLPDVSLEAVMASQMISKLNTGINQEMNQLLNSFHSQKEGDS